MIRAPRAATRRGMVFLCIALAAAMLLGACAPRQSEPPALPLSREGSEAAARIWAAYEARSRAAEGGPFRLNASLRYGPTNETRRVTVLVWGNGMQSVADSALSPEAAGVLRLDVMAGVGSLVARVRETPTRLTAFVPGENKAWEHQGSGRLLLHFGVPVPFSLTEFAALLQGRYDEVFGTKALDSREVRGGRQVYTLDGERLPGTLELTPDGLPLRWCQQAGQLTDSGGSAAQAAPCGSGWSMDLAYGEGAGLPRRISVAHPDGQIAIFLVKTREAAAPFTPEQLDLKLPAGLKPQPFSAAPKG